MRFILCKRSYKQYKYFSIRLYIYSYAFYNFSKFLFCKRLKANMLIIARVKGDRYHGSIIFTSTVLYTNYSSQIDKFKNYKIPQMYTAQKNQLL